MSCVVLKSWFGIRYGEDGSGAGMAGIIQSLGGDMVMGNTATQ